MAREKIGAISLTKVLKVLKDLRKEEGVKTTLLGIGPMSENIVRATLELARDDDFPAVFIASRNQVDAKELGGGYILNWDQKKFVETVNRIAEQVSFNGLLFICRDHGGPWQRDDEKKLPEKEAMKRAKFSYLRDLLAGFNVLHIDPTIDPYLKGYVPLDTVIRRTLKIINYLEKERQKRGVGAVSYEVGTEKTAGGFIDSRTFEQFLINLNQELNIRNLPKPDLIVGQTGTLIKMQRNVGQFDAEKAKDLVSIAGRYNVGFKEHNADFLKLELLQAHPRLGITAANTGPEFSVTETKTYLKLAEAEEAAIKEQKLTRSSSFIPVVQEAVLKSGHWRKWLAREEVGLTEDAIVRDQHKLREITEVSGRYVFDYNSVKQAREKLFYNLRSIGITTNPQREVLRAVKRSIQRWVGAFNLKGITSKILAKIEIECLNTNDD